MAKKKLFQVPSWIKWIGKLTPDGKEDLDPSPVSMPLGAKRPERLEDQIARLVRSHEYQAVMNGDDTLEEAMDFDVEEDFDPTSPFETEFDENLGREISPQEWHENRDHFLAEVKKRYRNNERMAEAFSDLDEAYQQARRRRAEQSGSGRQPRTRDKEPEPE